MNVLKVQMVLAAVLMLPVVYLLAARMLPSSFALQGVQHNKVGKLAHIDATPLKAFICTVLGTIGGLIIGEADYAGKFLTATVKGDVHDIG